MKKIGFTLAEMTIAVAIVGAIAAISVPLVNNIVPDSKKIKVLKVYKQLFSINQDILSDPGLYAGSDLKADGKPLRENWPENSDLKNFDEGDSKYLAILANALKPKSYDITANSAQGSITTSDGLVWNFDKDGDNIIVTIDTGDGGGCTHSSKCSNPDQFIFIVKPNGNVIGGDSLTKTYLANPNKLSDRKNDFKNSLSLSSSTSEDKPASEK